MLVRILNVLGAGILALACWVALAFGVGLLFGPLYKSEQDMSRNVMMFLVGGVGACVIGGAVGNRRYMRRKRPPGRVKSGRPERGVSRSNR